MSVLAVVLIIGGNLVIGLLAGAMLGHFAMLPADRQRLDVIAERLVAEHRLAVMTRQAVQAMRDEARRTSSW